MLTPVHRPKSLQWASDLDHGAIKNGAKKSNELLLFLTMWVARCMCHLSGEEMGAGCCMERRPIECGALGRVLLGNMSWLPVVFTVTCTTY